MCIIAIKPKGVEMFDDRTIEAMFTNNPDGAGYMYYDTKLHKVVIKKGFMTLKEFKKELKKHDFKNTNLILHFRIGTSGKNDRLNCHPYPIYEVNATSVKTNLGMAHNGILHDYEPAKGSEINDTQLFIRTVLRKLDKGFLKDENITFLIEELIGANKLAFLDSNNKVTLIGNGFIEDKGYIYSNDSYKKPRHVYTTSKFSLNDQFPYDAWGIWENWEPVKPLKK